MADPVRNIIIKLGSKTHSPEVAFKHIQTLLQFAMKKKLKLDPLLRDEILVTVMTYYPEFYAEWSEDDATKLLMMVSEASDEVSPVSRRQAEAHPLYLEAAQKEAKHRQEILRNRSNNFETPIEISPDKPDVSATPSCVPVISENLTALDSENPPVNVDSTSLFVSESVGVKTDVLHVSDEKGKSSDEPNKLSLVVYASDNVSLPPAEIADDPKEVCTVVDTHVLPANVESVDLSSPHKSEKTGGIHADVDQPEKKRKSSEGVKPEENPPIQQVFKTLRSSVKQKGPAVQVTSVPAPSVKKGKPSTRSRGRSINPEVQPVEETDPSVYMPQFVSPAAQTKWSTLVKRDLIVQRSVDENQLHSVCDILPLVNEVGLLKTVTNICPYSKLLTYEFYCNLNDEIDILSRLRPMQIFIRGRWYVFGPDMINEYYGLTAVQEDPVTDWNLVARTLTGGQTKSWPTGDKDYLQSSHLTSRYVILHRLALHNWLPSAHFHIVGKLLAGFLFRIGTKMPLDLGKWIYYHILTLIHPREQKVRLPFPNLIFGILTTQGIEPMPSEVISPTLLYTVDKRLLTGDHIRDVVPVSAPSNYEPDAVSDDSPHAKDV
ncbi:PREDICTED: uncharacterized protein LOC109153912 [Ipomoea nil]|uniref:uncharacterized protein LOC109153912 n=1 Tax=Ipomoea nil TaxID=35883 RepID=UPI0009013AC2|nr:PREDICTED: uncharacterized protein LOC109153912 [Ipomoea nil]